MRYLRCWEWADNTIRSIDMLDKRFNGGGKLGRVLAEQAFARLGAQAAEQHASKREEDLLKPQLPGLKERRR